MDFIEIREDYISILPYLKKSDSKMCDYFLATVFIWGEYFDNSFYIIDNTLVIAGKFVDGRRFFSLVNNRENTQLLRNLRDFSMKKYGYFLLHPVASEELPFYDSAFDDNPSISPEVNWFDYIYSIEDLAELRGGKYHGKKNFVNRFTKDYSNIEIIPAENADIRDINEFLDRYGESVGGSDDEAVLKYEISKIRELLPKLADFDVTGLVVMVDKKVVGFTLGGVYDDTLFVCIEKADRRYAGAYAFINKTFCEYVRGKYPNVKYVNREDDNGDEGLRKAKESYHPLYKLEKYLLCWKC